MVIELGESGRLFVWDNGEFTRLVVAKDEEEAYRKVIAWRLRYAADVGEAAAWFDRNDTLEEVDVEGGVLDMEPYLGELPD